MFDIAFFMGKMQGYSFSLKGEDVMMFLKRHSCVHKLVSLFPLTLWFFSRPRNHHGCDVNKCIQLG